MRVIAISDLVAAIVDAELLDESFDDFDDADIVNELLAIG